MENETIAIALIGLISIGFGYLAHFLNKYLEYIKIQSEKIQNDQSVTLFQNAITIVEKMVDAKVRETEQVIVSDLRKHIKDGNLSKDELVILGQEVKEQIITNLSDDVKSILEQNIYNIEDFVSSLVESKVLKLKK